MEIEHEEGGDRRNDASANKQIGISRKWPARGFDQQHTEERNHDEPHEKGLPGGKTPRSSQITTARSTAKTTYCAIHHARASEPDRPASQRAVRIEAHGSVTKMRSAATCKVRQRKRDEGERKATERIRFVALRHAKPLTHNFADVAPQRSDQ